MVHSRVFQLQQVRTLNYMLFQYNKPYYIYTDNVLEWNSENWQRFCRISLFLKRLFLQVLDCSRDSCSWTMKGPIPTEVANQNKLPQNTLIS